MRRLFSSVEDYVQGAVPRDFDTPNSCLVVEQADPVTPPGCVAWPVIDNNYGGLPQNWPLSVASGDLYHEFFSTISVVPDPVWTPLVDLLTVEQRNQILESGCYCADDSMMTPTLLTGVPKFPKIDPISFMWLANPTEQVIPAVESVRASNPVERKLPGNCCPGSAPAEEKANMEIAGGELRLTLDLKEQPEQMYRTTSTSPAYLAQAGFPRYCCTTDPCDNTKSIETYLHYPTWLSDIYDPYGAVQPEEPLGIIPFMMDMQWDMDTGTFMKIYAHAIVHDGLIHQVIWDADSPHATDDPGYGVIPTEPGQGLGYNKDWRGNGLIDDTNAQDPCKAPCAGAAGDDCTPVCSNVMCPDGLIVGAQTVAFDATEIGAIDSALSTAGAGSILCFSKRHTDGTYAATAMLCVEPPP